MKLVEIKDIRPGQIWKDKDKYKVILENHYDDGTYIRTYDFSCKELKECDPDEYILDDILVGKLGITHRIEDGKLVEIPRTEEFQIDDVVRHESGKAGVIVKINNVGFAVGYEYSINCGDEGFNDTFEYITKIGILGVTHEFVNDREVLNEV